ncbi:Sugar transferase [Alteracholeplasma palmae J233]|uniref:Sugar transferase n=1 Tax=Alteracholeplasma palmae (strain ATCC 49389 / J233) TaxID=1318466 RepID=U4KLI2_ALTPJ|nr:sugar transferase [Alteracholeplasma palmae]CCV64698.1 Sugar transferase [Alteracholeplasma palmae J233]
MYKYLLKPIMDFILSLLAIIIFSPLLLIVALLVKLTSKGPILFKQKRVGKNKKLFNIYKFRTMRIDTPKDAPTHTLENPDKYITKVGKFLRKTSLDELPQLFNILFGKMSIVGPRPALWNQDDLIAERDKYQANDVKPGLTGLAQVSGRDELEIPVKAKIDGEYVKKITLLKDFKLIFKTAFKVLKSDGVKEGKDEKNTNNRG